MGRKFITKDIRKLNRFLHSWEEIEVKGDFRKNTLALARGLYKKLIEESPVDTGNFRINTRWDINRDVAITIEAPVTKPEKGSSPNTKEWNSSNYYSVEARFDIGNSIYISNHVPYVYQVEFDGWANTSAYRPFLRSYAYVVSNPNKAITLGNIR